MKPYFFLVSILAIVLLVSSPGTASATYSSVINDMIRMYQSGLTEELILEYLKANQIIIQLTADDLIALRQAGLSESFIAALIELIGAPFDYEQGPAKGYGAMYPPSFYTSYYGGASFYPGFFYSDYYPHVHIPPDFLHDNDHIHHGGHTFIHRDDPSLPYHGDGGFVHHDDHVHHDGHTYVHDDNYLQINGHDYFRHNGHFHQDDEHQYANLPNLSAEPRGQSAGSSSGFKRTFGLEHLAPASAYSHQIEYGSMSKRTGLSTYIPGGHSGYSGSNHNGSHSGTSLSNHSSHSSNRSISGSRSSHNHGSSAPSHSSSSHSHSGSHSSGHSHN